MTDTERGWLRVAFERLSALAATTARVYRNEARRTSYPTEASTDGHANPELEHLLEEMVGEAAGVVRLLHNERLSNWPPGLRGGEPNQVQIFVKSKYAGASEVYIGSSGAHFSLRGEVQSGGGGRPGVSY